MAAIGAALPEAVPNAAALMFLAQVPFLDAAAGARVVDQIGQYFPPGAWYFDQERLDQWPDTVADCAMGHIRRLAPGWRRVLAFCEVAERLTDEERHEAFVGIIDRTLASGSCVYNIPMSFEEQKTDLLRLMPREKQEAWVGSRCEAEPTHLRLCTEVYARLRLDLLSEDVIRGLYERLEEAWEPGERPPLGLYSLFDKLAPDLRESVLRRVRQLSLDCSWQFLALAGDLSDAEYREVMQPPVEPIRLSMNRTVERFLPRAPYDVVVRWLDTMLSLGDYERQFGVSKLLPLLRGAERRRAEEALLGSILRLGECDGFLWHLVPEVHLESLLWRLRSDSYGWHRDGLIEHIIAERDQACAERCFLPLVDVLGTLGPDHRFEIVTAMTPWLAARTERQLPAALARLPIRASVRQENQQYTIERVLLNESELDDQQD